MTRDGANGTAKTLLICWHRVYGADSCLPIEASQRLFSRTISNTRARAGIRRLASTDGTPKTLT